MSKTYTIYATKMAQINENGVYITNANSYKPGVGRTVWMEFEDFPETLRTISSINRSLFLYFFGQDGVTPQYGTYPRIKALHRSDEIIDIDIGQYPEDPRSNDTPTFYVYPYYTNAGNGLYDVKSGYSEKSVQAWAGGIEIAEAGIGLWQNNTPYLEIASVNSENPPYLLFTYDEGSPITLINYPVGYIDRTQSNEFSWHTTYSGFPVEDIAQTSATLQWKNGSNGAVNSITINGAVTTYTMPANTLPVSDEIYWRVVAVTSEGTTNPEWTQVRTTDSPTVSTAISPSGTYVDGTKAVLFTWNHSTDTGTAQTAYDLQIKSSTGDWTTVQSATTSDEFCNLPANTLPSGTVQWRVRTYNADGTAGSWSNELTIVVIAAPAAPAIQIDVVSPMPQISWTSQEQQAFQVQMGIYDSGLQFGTVKSYKCPVYLPDGSTRMRVRVLNEYHLWSDWAEAVATITNVPKTAPVLVITAERDAQLAWESNETAAAYWVYRDGERIAKTANTSYTDRLAIGSHTYYVRETYASSDDYTDSNTVVATMKTDHPIICTLDGTGWISLRFSTNSVQSVQVSEQQEIALAQYAGAVYPVPEVAPYRQRNYSISTAYMDTAACAQFEALLGKRVCVKDQYNNLIVGVITSYAKTSVPFYTAYTATVYEIDKGEYLEDD